MGCGLDFTLDTYNNNNNNNNNVEEHLDPSTDHTLINWFLKSPSPIQYDEILEIMPKL